MKKFKFIWLIGAILSLTLFSCDSDDGGDDDNGNVLSNNYFSIDDATFVNANIPEGSTNVISDFSVNQTAITGGSSIVSFSSSEELSAVYVGVEGEKGYYKYDLTSTRSTASVYSYQVILLISQSITNDFVLHLSAVTVNGATTSVVSSDEIEVTEVGTGALQVSLSWDQYDDVDLHLFEPDGTHIYYANPYSYSSSTAEEEAYYGFMYYMVEKYTNYDISGLNINNLNDLYILSEYFEMIEISEDTWDSEYDQYFANFVTLGFLDLDSNAGCSIDEINNENITYESNVKEGKYTVAVNLWSKCNSSTAGAKYSVTAIYNGKHITLDKPTGQFADSYEGNPYDYESEFVIIGTFTIGEGGLRSSEIKPENPVVQQIKRKVFKSKK